MRLRPAGEHAVLVELEDLEAAHGLAAAVRDARLPGVVDVVLFDPHREPPDDHHEASTKRSRSPGASRAGGSRCGSNSTTSVCPSSCQPPGVVRG